MNESLERRVYPASLGWQILPLEGGGEAPFSSLTGRGSEPEALQAQISEAHTMELHFYDVAQSPTLPFTASGGPATLATACQAGWGLYA